MSRSLYSNDKYGKLSIKEKFKRNCAACHTCMNVDDWFKDGCIKRVRTYYWNVEFEINFTNTCSGYKEDWLNVIKYGKWSIRKV